MAYYPENRDVTDGVSKLASQLAVDMASNILKEFWPDLERKFSRKRAAARLSLITSIHITSIHRRGE
jgi:hypothetical protein